MFQLVAVAEQTGLNLVVKPTERSSTIQMIDTYHIVKHMRRLDRAFDVGKISQHMPFWYIFLMCKSLQFSNHLLLGERSKI